jgi:uncharacterized protein YgiM (DUF1202 family)
MKKNYNKMFDENMQKEKDEEIVKTLEKKKDEVPPAEPKTFTVTSKGKLNVRKTAGRDGELVCQIGSGEKVQVESIEDEWAHIYTSSGIEGYVMAEFIKED